MYDGSLIGASLVLIFLHSTTNSEGAVSVLSESYYAAEGSNVLINCSVTAETFKGWFDSKGQKISADLSQRLHVKKNGNLHLLEINTVSKSDYGQYECRGERNKTEVMLYVEYGPILNRERSASKTIFSALGSNEQITLNCVFDGFPAPRVRFKKMGKVLNNSGISYGSGSASYKFSVKSENDFGFYTCDASNSRGCAFHYIEVYKTGPPEPPNNIQVFPNCDRIDVTWDPAVKDGGSKLLGYKIELSREGRTLKSEPLSASTRARSFKELEAETLYEVRLNSRNAIGDGEWRSLPVNTTLPCSSQALSSASSSSIFFAWTWITSAHFML